MNIIVSRKFCSFYNLRSLPLAGSLLARQHHCETQEKRGWRVLKLAHIAIATPDCGKASILYKDLFGLHVSDQKSSPEQKVNAVMVDFGNSLVEVIDAKGYGDQSPINKFLEKSKKGGLHHLCIEVDNLAVCLKDLQSRGIRSLDPEPRIGARGNPVAFLHPSDCNGVLIELEEQ